MASDKPSNSERLNTLLQEAGVDQKAVLDEALAEIRNENLISAKAKTKDLLKKALDLQRQMSEAEAQFRKQTQKWDQELGKLLNQISNLRSGKPPAEEPEKAEEKPAEETKA